MSEYQFPPSSPVLNAADADFDPFRTKDLPRGRHEYPTPNPSSTAGRSSSPARHEDDKPKPASAKHVAFELPGGNEAAKPLKAFGSHVPGGKEPVRGVFGSHPAHTKKESLMKAFGHGANKYLGGAGSAAKNPTRATVSINRDFNILNPDAAVLRIPLTATKPSVIVGRSSKTCDFHFKTADKTVSRAHVRVDHTPTSIVFTCLGHNGMGMVVPRVCQVINTHDKVFVLRESGKPLLSHTLSKTIILDYQHTEFHVARGERVEMPRFANILLQVRDHVMLVNPDDCDEEMTDDEMPVISPAPVSTATPQAFIVPAPRTPQKLIQVHPQEDDPTPSKLARPTKAVTAAPKPVLPKAEAVAKPMRAAVPTTIMAPSTPATPVTPATPATPATLATPVALAAAQVTAPIVAPVKIQTQAVAPVSAKRASTPLSDRSTNLPQTPPAKRRAISEEPSLKKHRTDAFKPEIAASDRDKDGKVIIDQGCLENVSKLGEIKNILINHLAFLRLSSTPGSFLNTILAVVSTLSLAQLRAVLNLVECIGIIYRQGKDAAGKPLEEEYYYIPEKDTDPERQTLVGLIKGHGGLRACRKTHKQYYWKRPAPIKK